MHTYPDHLHGNELEALVLETLDDLADESTLDTVGLDHDEGALLVVGHDCGWEDVCWRPYDLKRRRRV